METGMAVDSANDSKVEPWQPNWPLLGFVVTTGFFGGAAVALWWWLCPKGQPALGFGAGGRGGPGFGFGGRAEGDSHRAGPLPLRLPEPPAPRVLRPDSRLSPLDVEDPRLIPSPRATTAPIPVPDAASRPELVRRLEQTLGQPQTPYRVSYVLPSPDEGAVRSPRAAVLTLPDGSRVELTGWDPSDPDPAPRTAAHDAWARRATNRLGSKLKAVWNRAVGRFGDYSLYRSPDGKRPLVAFPEVVSVEIFTSRPEDLLLRARRRWEALDPGWVENVLEGLGPEEYPRSTGEYSRIRLAPGS